MLIMRENYEMKRDRSLLNVRTLLGHRHLTFRFGGISVRKVSLRNSN